MADGLLCKIDAVCHTRRTTALPPLRFHKIIFDADCGRSSLTKRAGVSVPEAALQVEALLDVAAVHQVLHDDDVQVQRLLGRGPVLESDGVDADDLAEARVGRRADVVAVLGAERARHALVLRLVDPLYHEPATEITRAGVKQTECHRMLCGNLQMTFKLS